MKYSTKKKISTAIVFTSMGLMLLTLTGAKAMYKSEIQKTNLLLEKYGYSEYNQEYILNQSSSNPKDYDKIKFIDENASEVEKQSYELVLKILHTLALLVQVLFLL